MEFDYIIETPNGKKLESFINKKSFRYGEISAFQIDYCHVGILQLTGNCLDELDAIIDQFPDSYYTLTKE